MKVYNLDLHVHTPASHCFGDPIGPDTPRHLIRKARQVGLDMIAVTDHHTVSYVDWMRRVAEGSGVVVLPGVELSTCLREIDEVYFLAVFSEDKPQRELEAFLERLGIDRTNWGDCYFRIRQPVGAILEEIRREGGLVIGDHLDKTESRRRAIPELLNKYDVRAFDLRDLAYKAEIEKMLQKEGVVYCFSFSDAHGVEWLGTKFSRVELEECSFSALKALIEGK